MRPDSTGPATVAVGVAAKAYRRSNSSAANWRLRDWLPRDGRRGARAAPPSEREKRPRLEAPISTYPDTKILNSLLERQSQPTSRCSPRPTLRATTEPSAIQIAQPFQIRPLAGQSQGISTISGCSGKISASLQKRAAARPHTPRRPPRRGLLRPCFLPDCNDPHAPCRRCRRKRL